ncbi:hypothetical protein IQ256_20900 [cf. Phormidesmis sp. LEGE 11477]|nr:hypothetical protein [cf. Phormidesmis sp. LEGE 11477]
MLYSIHSAIALKEKKSLAQSLPPATKGCEERWPFSGVQQFFQWSHACSQLLWD